MTELLQQKKQAPVGGDFIELGSSLITLLNLAQEIGSSNNLRFRQAADKLRNQFARSFALRYDLEKSQFLSTALSSIDGDSHLTEGTIFCCNEHSSRIEIMNPAVCYFITLTSHGAPVEMDKRAFRLLYFCYPCDFWTKSVTLLCSAFYSARNKRHKWFISICKSSQHDCSCVLVRVELYDSCLTSSCTLFILYSARESLSFNHGLIYFLIATRNFTF